MYIKSFKVSIHDGHFINESHYLVVWQPTIAFSVAPVYKLSLDEVEMGDSRKFQSIPIPNTFGLGIDGIEHRFQVLNVCMFRS